jgi:hypothetical protein
MSTPIVMRTKSEQSPYSSQQPSSGAFKPPQFTQRPFQQVQPQQPQPVSLQQQQLQQQQQQKSECEIHFSGKHDALYIYLARLMAPIWDQKILVDLKPKSSQSDAADSLLFITFVDINLQWYLNKLNELRRFIDANFPHLKSLHHSYLTSSLFNPMATGNAAANQSPSAAASSRFATQFGSMPLNMPALLGLTAGSTAGN